MCHRGETRKADVLSDAPPTRGLEMLRGKQREAGTHLPDSPPETTAASAGSFGPLLFGQIKTLQLHFQQPSPSFG